MTTAPLLDLRRLGGFLDRLPTPLALVERETARTLYFNPAAQAEVVPWVPRQGVADYAEFEVYDAEDRRLGPDEMPAVRAARGEILRDLSVRWVVGGASRWLRVTAGPVELPDAPPAALIAFEDVTDLREAEARERAARIQFEAILENVADAVTAQGPDGRLLYANAAAVRLLGYASADELLAAPLDEVRDRFVFLTEDRRPFPLADLPGRRALMGEEPDPAIVRYRPLDGGAERWARVKAQPIRDAGGAVVMAINLIEDITTIKQAEYGQRFLAEAGKALASSLDYEETLRAVADLSVPRIADWCVVDLVADGGHERVAVVHRDPEMLRLAETVSRRYPPDPSLDRGIFRVFRTGESELYARLPDEVLQESAQDEEHLALLRQVGMTSVMIVPVCARSQVLGAITMVASESGRHFGPDDLALAEELGLRAGTAIENARLYRQRSEIAHALQASLLPPSLPDIDRVQAAAAFHAAGEAFDVGGDFYDLFPVSDALWYAVIGDVCGKGPHAAATTALVRYTVRAAAVRRRSPAAILQWLNDAMLRQDTGPTRFCTLVVVRVEPSAEAGVRCVLAGAGHPLPRVVRADGSVETAGAPGTLMGVTEDLVLSEETVTLAAGETLVLYTDGLIEARAPGHVWAPGDLDAALATAAAAGGPVQALVDGLVAAALPDTSGAIRDDLAVLALRAAGDAPETAP